MRSKTVAEIVKKIDVSEEFLIFTLGDSITNGSISTSLENSYTAVLTRRIAERYSDREVLRYDGRQSKTPDGELLPVDHFDGPTRVQEGNGGKLTVVRCGIGGNTVRRLINRRGDYAGRAFEGRVADLFTVMVGINDSLRGDPSKYVTPEQYKKDLYELLALLENANPQADVILMTPTYYHDGSTRESYLDLYAEKMTEVARECALPLIDTHKLWMDRMALGGEGYGQGDWLPSDKCHPGDVGHKALGEFIFSEIFE